MYVSVHECMYACVYECVYVCMYVCIYMCMYVCICVCVGELVGWLVVFFSISTLVGYLMPNPLYTFVLNRIYKWIFWRQHFLNKPELICLHTVKWFQVLLSNTYNSIQHKCFQVWQIIKLFYLFHWWNPNRYYNSRTEWTFE